MNSTTQSGRPRTVTILGGGFAGLLAALVCAKNGLQVNVLEKKSEASANCLPQGPHSHLLAKKGLDILFTLFPEVKDKFLKCGFPRLHFTQDIRWVGPYGTYPQFRSDFGDIFSFYRPKLDILIKEVLATLPQVKINYDEDYKELIQGRDDISGVVTFNKELNKTTNWVSDLVVIATGRYQDMKSLLGSCYLMGLREEIITSPLRYRSFTIKTDHFEKTNHKALMTTTFGSMCPHGTVMFPLGEQSYIVTQVAQNFDLDILSFAQTLHDDESFRILENATMDSKPINYKINGSRRFLTKGIKNWPKGLVVLGDSLIYLNPIFAQGLSLTLIHIEAFNNWITEDDSTYHLQLTLEELSQDAWMMGTIEDRRLNANLLEKPAFYIAEKYVGRILKKAVTDKDVYLKLVNTTNMMVPSYKLLNIPQMMAPKTAVPNRPELKVDTNLALQ